jgi:hypothetical protein
LDEEWHLHSKPFIHWKAITSIKALQPTVLPPLRCGKPAAELGRWKYNRKFSSQEKGYTVTAQLNESFYLKPLIRQAFMFSL